MARSAELPVPERPHSRKSAEVHRLRRRPQAQYYAFLSYSHRDEELADWLHRELEDFHVPPALAGKLTRNGVVPKRLAPIFRDEHELAAADDLGEEIEHALSSSQFLIVLCSPAAAKSRWTNAEIELFKRSRPEGCILAAIASGEPFASEIPGREHEECFPPALRRKYDRRGRPTNKRAEPLAADLREEGQSRWIGLMKLVAGMLGVGLDELVQRETTRRHKRMAWITAASVIGMLFASALAFTAIRSRDEAREQRRQAEGLVSFMLGDLRDKLEPIGKLDALDGVGSKVLAYYSKQDASQLSDAGLLQRSRALNLTAQVAFERGYLDQSAALYRQALAGTAEAVRRSPDDPKRIFDQAQNVFWLGEIARARGETDQAVAAYQEYKRLADRLIQLEPENLKWRMEGFYGVENTGISLYNKRRYEEAKRNFDAALGPMQNLAAVEPDNPTYQKELATVLGWVAQADWVLGRLDDSIAVRQREVAFLEAHLDGSGDVQLRQLLVVAHQALGLLLGQKGQFDQAVAEFRLALDQANRLMAVEPDNRVWKDYAASVQLDLGRLLLSAGHDDEARAQVSEACGLVATDPTHDASWRKLRTTCVDRRARLALASGATGPALVLADQAASSARAENSGDPITDRFRFAAQARLLGDIRRRSGDQEGALQAWSSGFNQLPANVAERPWELNERAQLLRRLGRADEARPTIEKLKAMGFKSVD